MIIKKLAWVCCVALLVAPLLQAQERDSSSSSASSGSSTTSAGVASGSGGDRGSSGVSATSSVGTAATSAAIGSTGTGYPSVGAPGYAYYPSFSSDYYRCIDFLYLLQRRYMFLPADLYLTRYVNGEPLLTSGLVQMALTDSWSYSDRLLQLSLELEEVVAELVGGASANPAASKKRAQELLTQIRKYSKKIKSDQFLEYIDTRENDDPVRGSSKNEGVERKVEELQSFVQQLRSELENIKSQKPSVIDVRNLSKPSVRSLSRSIEALASSVGSDLKKIG